MGSIKQNGKTYTIRYDLPGSTKKKRKQKQISGFRSQKEAAVALKHIESKIALGIMKEQRLDTVGDVVQSWFKNKVINVNAPGTIAFYENYITNYIEGIIDELKLSTIKVATITKYYDQLRANGASVSTIDKLHKTLRAAFYYCYQQELINDKFMDRVKIERYQANKLNDSENYWTPDVIKKLCLFL